MPLHAGGLAPLASAVAWLALGLAIAEVGPQALVAVHPALAVITATGLMRWQPLPAARARRWLADPG